MEVMWEKGFEGDTSNKAGQPVGTWWTVTAEEEKSITLGIVRR